MKYQINSILVNVKESTDSRWNHFIYKNLLERQLRGLVINEEDELKEKKISASLTIRDIKELNETKKTGKLVPGNSLLTEKAYFYQDIAITETKNQLELYCQRGSSISLPFFMHFLLKQQQKVLVHSAGVSIGGKGIILSAFGGIGKTAFTASILKEKNVKILGDDLVVLNKNGNLSAYQRPLGLYSYHKNLFPEYFKSDTRFFLPNSKFSNKYKLLKRIFNKSLKILNLDELFITESILISPENLFGLEKIESDEVPLKDAYIINRYNNLSKLECIHINDHQKIARFSKSVMAHEWVECCYRFLINKLAMEDKSIAEYEKELEDIYTEGFKQAENIYEIRIPDNYQSMRTAQELCEIVYKNL